MMKFLSVFLLILGFFIGSTEWISYAEPRPDDEPIIASESGLNSVDALAACNKSLRDWVYWRTQFREQYKISKPCTVKAVNGGWTAFAYGHAWSSSIPQEQY